MTHTATLAPAHATAAPPAALPEDKVARFCARLDAHLEGLCRRERLPFLQDQQIEWIAKYDRFCRRVEGGEQPHWGETATDYVITIAEIGARIGREQRR